MPWVKLDDHMSEHPKVVQAGPLAHLLFVCGLEYAARNLTDGLIPYRAIPLLTNWEDVLIRTHDGVEDVDPYNVAVELERAGLWEATDGGDYIIHDYLEYQPSKAQVLAERDRNKQRQAHWRQRNAGSNGVTDTVSAGLVTAPPYPVPDPVPGEKVVANEVPTGITVSALAPKVTAAGAIAFAALSEDARTVLSQWREYHGKRRPPNLNPALAQKLEAAVADLGVERLCEAARWSAEHAVGEFPKCINAAYTKRKRDEDDHHASNGRGVSGPGAAARSHVRSRDPAAEPRSASPFAKYNQP